ncbi:MAG: helix-turn-helix domain-containing protein [Actinobacteria bacterium]|jgi:transcriptional regulator with XRE-family HTH domain|nr:helix-turn-helix domain-containing protein [Actinomycetota bacterium]NCU89173.1 helix-turn-helix domain-containing protein [Actinomycetota bacterium]NCZ58375.1 helix-turn-helix domain-containing protein [Actinomycetota bacterium]NDE53941.1 helix-turn-helix domain-containing protein [Actinomycetota bacterium]
MGLACGWNTLTAPNRPNLSSMSMTTLVAQRLRHIRQQQNLTLKQVEIRSRGKWKSVVVGSYERGVRALSIAKAEELCAFYGVPAESLFLDPKVHSSMHDPRGIVLDLRKIRQRLSDPDLFTHQLHDFVSWIAAQRSDWNGEMMSLRKSDLDLITIITRKNQYELEEAIVNRNFTLIQRDRT